MQTSARNQFIGEVAEVKHGAVNDEVTLRTQDGLEIVAVITHGSATSLGLAAGKKAFALVKASSVIVMVDVASNQVSARNCIAGTVSAVTKGAVNSEVIIGAGRAQIAARKRQGGDGDLQGVERDRRRRSVNGMQRASRALSRSD
jgi:molybdate transport system regulatory protein